MTPPTVHLVDWRQQLSALREFLEDRGGVVQVIASDASPVSTFAKAVRHLMATENWSRRWCSVQIDGVNPSTHYLEDIIVQLERSLGVHATTGQRPSGSTVSVATDIRAENVEISDVSISMADDPFTQAEEVLHRIDRVSDAIRAEAHERRVALIFVESHAHDKRALARFRASAWDRSFAGLVDLGLLLIDISDPTGQDSENWPPTANLVVDLPERYGEASILEAIEDLAKLALSEGLVATEPEARVFARTLVASAASVREMHAGLARALLRFGDD